jgi:chorismate mutase/prephenate dehydratase
VPVENSVEGSVGGVLDMFADSPLVISAEIRLQITHFLVGRGPLVKIQRVYSHPQALGQCRNWLLQNLPHAQTIETSSTASSAERAASDPDGAGISTEAAAAQAGVGVLARSIQDHSHNTTRFAVLGRQVAARTGRDRTGILFVTQHRPGTLQQVLRQLSERDLNLTRIESRPSRRGTEPWEYLFFVDFDGHPDDPVVTEAIGAMRAVCQTLKVLGAWPIDDREDDAPGPSHRYVRN